MAENLISVSYQHFLFFPAVLSKRFLSCDVKTSVCVIKDSLWKLENHILTRCSVYIINPRQGVPGLTRGSWIGKGFLDWQGVPGLTRCAYPLGVNLHLSNPEPMLIEVVSIFKWVCAQNSKPHLCLRHYENLNLKLWFDRQMQWKFL